MDERENRGLAREWKDIVQVLPRLNPVEEKTFLKVSYGKELLDIDKARSRKTHNCPPVIEITGMPQVGKTTLIAETVELFKKLDVPYHIIEERSVPFDKDASHLYYNLHLFLSAAREVTALELSGQRKGITLIDRGIYNPLAFINVYLEKGEIGEREAGDFRRFVNDYYGGFIDALILFHGKSEKILKRTSKRGRVVNENFLPILEDAYRNIVSEISDSREQTLLRNSPLVLAEIETDQQLEQYKEIFQKIIGSICAFYS